MELTNSTPSATMKTPEVETETTTQTQPKSKKPSLLSNGVLKRHAPLNHQPMAATVTYKECVRNYAASMGGHAVDGCLEFLSSPIATHSDPTSLKCAACGCHRNFHRREVEEPLFPPPYPTLAIEYQPHHRHHPPPPLPSKPRNSSSPTNSPSPPPICSTYYYTSAPHMLMALSHGLSPPDNKKPISATADNKKRFRTKFTDDQKDKMVEFANKIEWKMQKKDENVITDFCSEIGVNKDVFKVWMHNHKNTSGSRNGTIFKALTTTTAAEHNHHQDGNNHYNGEDLGGHCHIQQNSSGHDLGTNGSSSSS
ncbi:zinc-finger homeodomain protein 9-like [Olea europaea var. sylvestris]|uniref:zinc-finger homeodomain protein 9-like n=1 Tax=Olea europaea var. sylvestris TaxID=158386 RepID=UPI000C1D28EA|nr:zinc-finger homeodomain protein 9-like [Olea europaea var. sylvestris]